MPDGAANLNQVKVASTSKRARRRPLGVMALEPRVMYDAAAVTTVATATLDPTHTTDSTATTTTGTATGSQTTEAAPTTDASTTTTTAVTDLAPPAVTGLAPTDTSSGHQVVFIDPHVPDYQLLAAGVKAGEEVVILDANTDGVQQIADWLASHDEHNVDAIHIVSHGEDGTVRLGSTILAANDVDQFAQPLAQIGAALKSGGDILFYGCDVGQGLAGGMFMAEMSMATGGAHIAAASHLVGAADQGGSWDLNVKLGTIDVANPFTEATLASFNDVLTDQIWFTTNGTGTTSTRIEQVSVDVSATDLIDKSGAGGSALNSLNGIVVDTARGVYFVASQVVTPDGSNANVEILKGSLATGALDSTPIYVGPTLINPTTGTFTNAYIAGLQLDIANGQLYFAQGVRDSTGHNVSTQTGIFKISETASNLTTNDATQVVSFPSTALDAPKNFALDFKDNLVFFTDNSGRGSTNSDSLGVGNLTTGAVSFMSATDLATAGVTNTTGLLSGIAVDADHGLLYFTTTDTNHTDHNYILRTSFTVSGSADTATATFGTIDRLYNVGSSGAPTSIVLDVPHGLFYVSNLTDNPDSSPLVSGNIQVGHLDGSQPLTTVIEASTFGGTSAIKPANLFLDATSVTAGDSVTFTQNGPAVVADAGLAIASAQNFVEAKVQITGGAFDGDTLAADNTGTNITWSYDAATHTLTLSGLGTRADYQKVLETVAFSSSSTDPTNGGKDLQRTLTWTVNDGVVKSDATSTVIVHEAPIVTAGATATFLGGGNPVTLDGMLTVSDPDGSGTLSNATVKIGAGFVAGDALNFTAQNGISGTYEASTGVLTLTGTATVANYQTALDSITYSFNPTNGDPTAGGGDKTRTITWVVNNGTVNSNAVTSTVDTVHVAPSVAAGDTVTFGAGGPPVKLDVGLTVSDLDSNDTLASAAVAISSGFAQGDTLVADTTGTNITWSYDSATHTLTLSGNDSLAHYQQVLETVAFGSSSADPTNGGAQTQRTLTWVVNDGVLTSKAATSTVMVDLPPTVVAGDTATFYGGGAPVTLDGTLKVGDTDSATLSGATVKIANGFITGDTLNFTDQNGITGSYDALTGMLTLSGSASTANYQAALDSITYSFNPANGDPTGGGGNTVRTITWVANDGVVPSNPVTSTLDTVHVAPTVDAGAATATFIGGGQPVTLDGSLTVNDVDSNGYLASATVSVSSGFVSGDTLAAVTTGTNITASYDVNAGVLTLTGQDTLAHYQSVLDSVTYSFSPANGDPTGGGGNTSRTISWQAYDGVATSNASTSTLDTVHVPPSITAGGTATFIGGGAPVTLDGSVTVSDPDSNGNLASATVSISGGLLSGDTLAAVTTGTGITASYDANAGVLTLTGKDTLGNYQKVLDSVTYSFSPANGDPTQGGNTTRTINWAVNDGVASSSSATSTVSTVNAVHVAPTLSGAGNTVLYAKHESGVTIDGALTVSDPDSGGMLTGATATISSGFTSGDTLAALTSGTKITASYNANTGVLTLTGQDTLANYQTVLDSVTYSSTSNNPSLGNKDTTRTITWVVDDGATNQNLSTPVTSTIDIVPELQSITHAPHGPHALSIRTAALAIPSLSNDTTLVTNVGFAEADEHDDTNVVPWPGSERRTDYESRAAVDLRHAVTATDAELLAARDRAASEQARDQRGDEPAAGKPGLLTQLKAAGRQGFVTERQALLKTLQQQRPGPR